MSRSRVKVTITRIFDVEFDDAPAAADMFKTLEAERQIAVLTRETGPGWKIRLASDYQAVEPLQE